MIVDFSELKKYRKQVAMVDGGFDPLHAGHIGYFAKTAEMGLPVLCNVSSDEYVSSKHPPFLRGVQRTSIIDSVRHISFTHLSTTTTAAVLRELQPKCYVKGKDWEGRLPAEEREVCKALGIEIIYLDTVLDSSSRLLSDYFGGKTGYASRVQDFERLVFSQGSFEPGTYDDEYFTGEWRGEGNTYDVESRRPIEGKNPQLIKEVFEPERVLDVGCGPGVLMYLLQELGVTVSGIDFSSHIRDLAPEEVRGAIMVGPVTEQLVPDDSYDLVICRETLEHLTVLQVREAVQSMCRASSRYVYVTTRFHPDSAHLLDVTDQFELDPTHITLLTKEFLRVMFVLEGFRSRSDLEGRMDWLGKGRVLVMEKQGPTGSGS
jgi:glycerol-3-phosphate cytidylyltransferase-like family protein/SAM-dependent methyltransferase